MEVPTLNQQNILWKGLDYKKFSLNAIYNELVSKVL